MPDEVKASESVERRVAASERAFKERNLIPAGFIDDFAHIAQEDWVLANGARVVARAWTDPDFRRRLAENGNPAVAELGFTMPEHHKHLVVLENTPALQNVICCTLSSCTAFTIIGLPPGWYKDFEYRSRIVRQSRTILREMGLDLPDAVEIKGVGHHQGFGPVRYASSRANALYSLGVGSASSTWDKYRHAIGMDGAAPLPVGKLLRTVADRVRNLCVEKGMVSHEELERLAEGPFPLSLPSAEGRLNAMPREPFAVGDRVRVKNEFVSGHVRMPGYIRGRVVVGISPPYPISGRFRPQSAIQDERIYDVSFRTEDLWPQAADRATVPVGVFESYLERAP